MSGSVDVEKIIALAEGLKKEASKLEAGFKARAKQPILVKLEGLNKAYMDAIKSSDGLTSARPSTLKAVQAAENGGSVETVKTAAKGLNDQLAEVKKSVKDDAAKKKFVKFEKNIDAIVSGLEKLL